MADENFHISDPTSLTTAQIVREVEHLKELFESRLGGYDKAIVLLQGIANRSPTINEVFLQHEEKFRTVHVQLAGIQTQFDERDERGRQKEEAANTALNAALASQKELFAQQTQNFKEATEKSDKQFKEQIDAQANLISTEVKGLVAQIDELKERLNRGEGKGDGIDKNKTDLRLWLAIAIAAIGVIFGIVMAVKG